jgi:peptidoglycan DL-endopeptidase CwlO
VRETNNEDGRSQTAWSGNCGNQHKFPPRSDVDRERGHALLAFAAVGERGTAVWAGIAAACVALLAALQLPAASGAESSSKLRQSAQSLRDENAALAGQTRAAWLSSVSLGTRLEQTRAGLARLQERTRSIAAKHAEAEEFLRLTRRTLRRSQQRLARRVRLLYEQGDADPMEVLVGAKSLEEALTGLESIHRIAHQDRIVIEQAEAARARLVQATKRLAAQEAQARRAEAATAATLAALEAARREQAAQLAAFRAQRSSNSTAISSLEAEARDLAAAPTPVPGVPQARGTITVTATGYALEGRTSTGVSVGYGIVAVDPSVIPLGTRMTIPGYGEGVAADTGGAVVGARIDLWFPTEAEALAWGTRTVSITLH